MKLVKAELLTIGDEILYGQIVDTNSQWMSAELDKIGIKTIRKTSIGDTEEEILQAVSEAESRADIILITGGLGPTNDDLTKPCLARYFGSEMVLNEEALAAITELFERRGRTLNERNRGQAFLPHNCTMVPNEVGTAPGMRFDKNGKVFFSMPGVPYEMKRMMENYVLPYLKATFQMPVILHQLVRTVGIPESILADRIQAWEEALPTHIKLAYLPSLNQVKLRLTAMGTSKEDLEKDIQKQLDSLFPLIGEYIFGTDEEHLEEKIGQLLLKHHKTIAFAESCTGGLVSHTITRVAGASAYYRGSIIPYHNELKINQLGVQKATLEKYGAVSEATVHEMANRVRERMGADIGIATSGIAGPSGGTPEKPVGLVWIAYADGKQTLTRELRLGTDRQQNIQLTTTQVLNLIRQTLSGND
ncbi:competence/damage-inducible protein A [Cytophagales bacterium LB-30]|uniref:CinA-like protein n=1 Tax=Shiella aurantiaca TaxID=3058365 RepID=A0ABT8F872_9BACT|nr:competence/damage-inducible protein A [Shiella aurantiaca]MDN4166579.1 competence/damage-inducible protein A [Shiella aurantiaca]